MPSAMPSPATASASAGQLSSARNGEEEENGVKAVAAGSAEGEEAEEEEEEQAVVLGFGREEALRMLAHLSNEQLLQVLQGATLRHPDVLAEVRRHVDRDLSRRKIFIRGLSWDTSTESLKLVFSAFGEVEEGAVIMDKSTGRSKGYGFITFRHIDSALVSLREPSKLIDGRMTVCRLAATGPSPVLRPQDLVARKIYVGNVPLHVAPQRLLEYFSQYGEIEEGPLGLDRQAGKSRGFALFIYKSAEAANRALEEPIKDLDGYQVSCKFAGDDQRQRFGAAAGSDARPPAVWNPGLPYGATPHGMACSFNQVTMNPANNSSSSPAVNAGYTQQSTGPTNSYPNAPTNTNANPSLMQGVSQAYLGASQPQAHMSYSQYTGMTLYGSHIPGYGAHSAETPTYGGQSASHSGSAMYSTQQGSLALHASSTQGSDQYSIMPQTAAAVHGSGQFTAATQADGTAHGSSYYNMASQATATQGTSQYAMGSYQNYQSDALSTAGQLPSTHQFYGA